MHGQRFIQEIEALDEEASRWWAWNPSAFYDLPMRGEIPDRPPISAGTATWHLEETRARKRRMAVHGMLGLAALLGFGAVFLFDAQPVVGSEIMWFLGGVAGAAVLSAPSCPRRFSSGPTPARRSAPCSAASWPSRARRTGRTFA